MACGRSRQLGTGIGRNAARPGGGLDHFPFAAFFFHFKNGNAVCGLRFAHFLGSPGGHAICKQKAFVGVLMVHGQQAALGTLLHKVMDAIVVHAKLGFLLCGAVTRVVLESVVFSRQAYGVSPWRNDLHRVAFGHGHDIRRRQRNTLKAQERDTACRSGTARHCRSTADRAQGRQKIAGQRAQAASQHRATRRLRDVMNAGVGGAIAVLHGREVFCHGVVRKNGWIRAARAARGVQPSLLFLRQ